jgi:hypothetical protein
MLIELNDINCRKVNPDWENVCIVAKSVVSNRQARLRRIGTGPKWMFTMPVNRYFSPEDWRDGSAVGIKRIVTTSCYQLRRPPRHDTL